MARINNTNKYSKNTEVTKEDFAIGTQASTGKTINIRVEDIVNLVPSVSDNGNIKEIKFKGENLPKINKTVEIPSKLSEFDNDIGVGGGKIDNISFKGEDLTVIDKRVELPSDLSEFTDNSSIIPDTSKFVDEVQVQNKIEDWSIKNIETISKLKQEIGKEGQKVRLLGYYSAGDKPELLYEWKTGLGEDDGGSVINSTGGRWEALFGNIIRLEDFGCKNQVNFDNSDIINKVVIYCGVNKKQIDITSINMEVNNPIVIDYDIVIKGNYRNSILTSKVTQDYTVIICDKNSIGGVIIDGLTINGNPNNNGIKLNKQENISRAVRDSSFKNIRLFNFGIGIAQYYSWCNIFENVRTQSCRTPLICGNQTNNTAFLRCSFANGNKTTTFTNCEGVKFDTCNFANYNMNKDGDTNIMKLYQSNVLVINPYYEYLNESYIEVGATSEVLKSTFLSIGGKSTDNEVRIRMSGDNNTIHCYGLNQSSRYVISNKNIAPTSFTKINLVEIKQEGEPIYVFKGRGEITLPKYGSQNISLKTYSNESVLFNSTSSTGYRVSNMLEINEWYTLKVNINKLKGGFIVRHGGQTNILENGDNIYYFRANAVDIYLHSSSSVESEIEIKEITLIKGTVDIFKYKDDEQSSLEIVNVGKWNKGESYNLIQGTGFKKMLCIKSGEFGTAKEPEIIQENIETITPYPVNFGSNYTQNTSFGEASILKKGDEVAFKLFANKSTNVEVGDTVFTLQPELRPKNPEFIVGHGGNGAMVVWLMIEPTTGAVKVQEFPTEGSVTTMNAIVMSGSFFIRE